MMDFTNIYNEIIEHIDINVYVVDLEDMTLQYISPKLKDMINNIALSKNSCYKALHEAKSPCLYCPCKFLSEENKYIELDAPCKLFSQNTNHKFIYTKQNEKSYMIVILSPEISQNHEDDYKRDEMYKTLVNLTKTLMVNNELEPRLQKSLLSIKTFYGADECYFYKINRNQLYSSGKMDTPFPLENNILFAEWVQYFKTNRILRKEHGLPNSNKYITSVDGKDFIAVSVKRHGTCEGFLYVVNPTENKEMTVLLSTVAPFIETEFEEDDVTTHLDRLAYYDFLSGLRNRTSYNERLEALEEHSEPIGILFIDINGLKEGNDTYGHEYGDRMIQTISTELKEYFKEDIYRIGGDEFVVFKTNVSDPGFKKYVRDFIESRPNTVSASFGYEWFSNTKNIEKKIAAVDHMMYLEKEKYHKEHSLR